MGEADGGTHPVIIRRGQVLRNLALQAMIFEAGCDATFIIRLGSARYCPSFQSGFSYQEIAFPRAEEDALLRIHTVLFCHGRIVVVLTGQGADKAGQVVPFTGYPGTPGITRVDREHRFGVIVRVH